MRSGQVLCIALIATLAYRPLLAASPDLPGLLERIHPGLPEPPAAFPLTLEAALAETLSRNPDLVTIRQDVPVSAAAVAIARKFPRSLNPTLSMDVRPWTFDPDAGTGSPKLGTLVSVSWMQPIQIGRRRLRRTVIARADFTQTQWNVLQAELLALVETYRLHQTATYRRATLEVARQLAEFNSQLRDVSLRQFEAAQITPADLVLAEVANQSMIQRLQMAEQEFVGTLAKLREQIGLPEYAQTVVPVGELKVPDGQLLGAEEDLTGIALETHPKINAARTRVVATRAAVRLARAERFPNPSLGPVYETDEAGATFYGVVASTAVPVLNFGGTLVNQRQMEYRRAQVTLEQLRIRTIARVRASLAKWNRTQDLVAKMIASTEAIREQTDRMQRLYSAGQTDLLRFLAVRQRLIEAERARLDMVWQATQAYAELLVAMGGAPLLAAVPPEMPVSRVAQGNE